MDENKHRQFESLYKLSEQAWRDWDHKTKHEWKLTFSIWAALLGIVATIDKLEWPLSLGVATYLGMVIFTIHGFFLFWIQTRLRVFRREMNALTLKMRELTNRDLSPPGSTFEFVSGIVSPIIQLAITLLIILVLVFMSAKGVRSTTQVTGCCHVTNAMATRGDNSCVDRHHHRCLGRTYEMGCCAIQHTWKSRPQVMPDSSAH